MTATPLEIMNEIAAQVRTCTLCDLHLSRTHAVPGAGNIETDILFIGEGPGANEDQQGLPFVGRSGTYLTKLIALTGLSRAEVFITNVVKCRPPDNRDPTPHEITTCKAYLDRQIETIDPKVIVTLGRYSMYRYFPDAKITQIHGKPRFDEDAMRAYMPMFHPAAVLRNPNLQPQMEGAFKLLPRMVARVNELREQKASGGAGDSSLNMSQDQPPPAPPTDQHEDDDDAPRQLPLF
jgi:uracil-DNA glycosylase family 4